MKAGTTNIDVGTKIRITKIVDDEESHFLVGQEGYITHPYPGLSCPGINYACGIYWNYGKSNLTKEDEFEIVNH